jgi:hypothetical protein
MNLNICLIFFILFYLFPLFYFRGNEEVTLLQPRVTKMAMLGLGSSIGTQPEGITAEAVVVESFDELKAMEPSKVFD